MNRYTDVSNIFRIKTLYTAFSEKLGGDFFFEGESHNFWEIVLVIEGEIGITAGSDAFVLHKGQAVLHEPMEFHRLWSENNSCPEIVVFTFAAENMPKLSSKFFEIHNFTEPSDVVSNLREHFIASQYRLHGIHNEETLQHQLAVKLLELLLLRIFMQNRVCELPPKTQSAKNYARIVTFLENNVDKNLSVPEIAALCKMGTANLKKTFSTYAGIGVMNYFNKLKVTASITMLKNGMTVQEVSSALGFVNQNYFSTVFKRITGKSPAQYKKAFLMRQPPIPQSWGQVGTLV